MFGDDEVQRYSRQIMVPEIGGPGQQKLKSANVLIVGAGGLGCPIALYLAAAGVGKLAVIDGDKVDLSNLNRQVLYGIEDVGRAKVSLMGRLLDVNPELVVLDHGEHVTSADQHSFAPFDLVVDGTDNFAARSTVNEICMRDNVPLLSAAVAGWSGQIALYRGQPCYRCWVDEPRHRDPCGVLGAMAGIMGTMAACEAVKVLLGLSTLEGRLLTYDGLSCETQIVPLARDPECPHCSK